MSATEGYETPWNAADPPPRSLYNPPQLPPNEGDGRTGWREGVQLDFPGSDYSFSEWLPTETLLRHGTLWRWCAHLAPRASPWPRTSTALEGLTELAADDISPLGHMLALGQL